MPWGYPCNRTEGGAHTGRGAADDCCEVGFGDEGAFAPLAVSDALAAK